MSREFTMPLRPSSASAEPRRRSVVAAVAALGAGGVPLLTSGCGTGNDEAGAPGPAEDSETAQRLRRTEAGRRRALLDRYDRTLAAHAPLAGRLKPLRAAVAEQAAALDGGGARKPAAGRSSKSPESGGDAAAVPAKEKDALAALAGEEQRVADRHTAALTGAPPELARLLASVAAAGSAHAYLLGEDEA